MADFAKLIGANQSTVSRYEADRLVPSRTALILLLQFATEEQERGPIVKALGVESGLLEGWHSGDLVEALKDFESYLAVKRPGKASKAKDPLREFAELAHKILKEIGSVDRSIVDILRLWIRYRDSAGDEFQNAASYLDVQLTISTHGSQRK